MPYQDVGVRKYVIETKVYYELRGFSRAIRRVSALRYNIVTERNTGHDIVKNIAGIVEVSMFNPTTRIPDKMYVKRTEELGKLLMQLKAALDERVGRKDKLAKDDTFNDQSQAFYNATLALEEIVENESNHMTREMVEEELLLEWNTP